MLSILLSLAILAAAYGTWRLYRRRPVEGRWAMIALAVAASVLAIGRLRTVLQPETPFVPRGVHYAGGVRLGEMAATALADGTAALVVRPSFDHPARAAIADSQIEGIREGLAARRARMVVVEFNMFEDPFLPPSVPRITPEHVREWVAQHPDTGAIISLAGAPRVEAGVRVENLPPFFALSFTEFGMLGNAFQSGLLHGGIMQTATGRDLDLRQLTPREVFEQCFLAVTREDVRAGRVRFGQ